MMEPSTEDDFTREMNDIVDLGEQVIAAFQSCEDRDKLQKGLERISK
jgi:hypothetical protein